MSLILAAINDTGTPVENLPPVSLIPVVHLELRIYPQIFEKFEVVLMEYSGAGGN